MTAPALSDVATFDDLQQTAYGSTTSAGNFKQGQMSFSGSGLIMKNGVNGNSDSLGMYAEPYHDHSNYLAIMAGQSETISFASEQKQFGLYWGSIDTYNYVEFVDKGNVVARFSGSDIAPWTPTPYGDQQSDGSNRYVIFDGLPRFDAVVLSSGGNSFEIDNIASGVPETSTWAMMLIGFVGLGFWVSRKAYRETKNRYAIFDGLAGC